MFRELKMRKRKLYNYIFDKKTILAGYRGSYAHNTYLSPKEDKEWGTCDLDMFEIFRYPKEYYLSLESWGGKKDVEEKVEGELDIVGYDIRKAFHLLSQSNPNVITWLFNRRNMYSTVSDEGELILENRQLFLSKNNVRDRFVGYAYGQLKRMTTGAFNGYMGDKRKKIVKKVGYDTKNAMTLFKLLRWGKEFLLTGSANIYRVDDRDFLLDVKRGKLTLPTIHKLVDQEMQLMDKAFEKSVLPEKVNMVKINELLIKILE